MPKFKVQQGPLAAALCATCEEGLMFETTNGQMEARCHQGGMVARRVPPNIVRCSGYVDVRAVTKYQLEKIAWVIRHDRSGRIKGFEPPPKKQDD